MNGGKRKAQREAQRTTENVSKYNLRKLNKNIEISEINKNFTNSNKQNNNNKKKRKSKVEQNNSLNSYVETQITVQNSNLIQQNLDLISDSNIMNTNLSLNITNSRISHFINQ